MKDKEYGYCDNKCQAHNKIFTFVNKLHDSWTSQYHNQYYHPIDIDASSILISSGYLLLFSIIIDISSQNLVLQCHDHPSSKNLMATDTRKFLPSRRVC